MKRKFGTSFGSRAGNRHSIKRLNSLSLSLQHPRGLRSLQDSLVSFTSSTTRVLPLQRPLLHSFYPPDPSFLSSWSIHSVLTLLRHPNPSHIMYSLPIHYSLERSHLVTQFTSSGWNIFCEVFQSWPRCAISSQREGSKQVYFHVFDTWRRVCVARAGGNNLFYLLYRLILSATWILSKI